uniref:SH3 domain-containing protein n=1 Tax=Eptatretus burgeri TaxID=7764 RepID=A0A8C4WTX6_EPTBU
MTTPKVTLEELVLRVQTAGDEAEKHIIIAETEIQQDIKNLEAKKALKNAQHTLEELKKAEEIVGSPITADIQQITTDGHAQAKLITMDIDLLRAHIADLLTNHNELYKENKIPEVTWGEHLLTKIQHKRVCMFRQPFAVDLVRLEEQLAANIMFQHDVKALADEVEKEKETNTEVEKEYASLVEEANKYDKHLNDLHKFMKKCTRELIWLDTQQTERLHIDWSDRNTEYDSRALLHQRTLVNDVVDEEKNISVLQQEGKKFVEANHPAKQTIEVYLGAIDSDWNHFLNFLVAEEVHLEALKQYHTLRNIIQRKLGWLGRQDIELKRHFTPEPGDHITRIEFLLKDIQNREIELQECEVTVKELKDLANTISPLRLRREQSPNSIPAELVCDFTQDEISFKKGDKVSVNEIDPPEKWLVRLPNEEEMSIQSLFLYLSPPDPSSIELVKGLEEQLKNVMKRQQGLEEKLAARLVVLQGMNVQEMVEEQKAQTLISDLEEMYYILDTQQMSWQGELNHPLDRKDPQADCVLRMTEFEKAHLVIQDVRDRFPQSKDEGENFLGIGNEFPSKSKLTDLIQETSNKLDTVIQIMDGFSYKLIASKSLEGKLKEVAADLEPIENTLLEDHTLPFTPDKTLECKKELQKIEEKLRASKVKLDDASSLLQDSLAAQLKMAAFGVGACLDAGRQEAKLESLYLRHAEATRQSAFRIIQLDLGESKLKVCGSKQDDFVEWLWTFPKAEESIPKTLEEMKTAIEEEEKLVMDIDNKKPQLILLQKSMQDSITCIKDYEKAAERYKIVVETTSNSQSPLTLKGPPSLADGVSGRMKQIVKEFIELSVAHEQRLVYLESLKAMLEELEAKKKEEGAVDSDQQQKAAEEEPEKEDIAEMKEIVEAPEDDVPDEPADAGVQALGEDDDLLAAISKLKNQYNEERQSRRESEEKLNDLQEKIEDFKRSLDTLEEDIEAEDDPFLEPSLTGIEELLEDEKFTVTDPTIPEDVQPDKDTLPAESDYKDVLENLKKQLAEEKRIREETDRHILKLLQDTENARLQQQSETPDAGIAKPTEPKTQTALEKDVENLRQQLQEEKWKNEEADREIRMLRLDIIDLGSKASAQPIYTNAPKEVLRLMKLLEEEKRKVQESEDKLRAMTKAQTAALLPDTQLDKNITQLKDEDPKTLWQELVKESQKRKEAENEIGKLQIQLSMMDSTAATMGTQKHVADILEACNKCKDLETKLDTMRRTTEEDINRTQKILRDALTMAPSSSEDQQIAQITMLLEEETRLRKMKEDEVARQLSRQQGLQSQTDQLQKALGRSGKALKMKEEEVAKLMDQLTKATQNVATQHKEKSQSHMKQRVKVIDPDTGRELTPAQAYQEDLIDWKTFCQLQGQECDWEEVTITGPEGMSTMLHDRKSGNRIDVAEAIHKGLGTQADLDRYRAGNITIVELATKLSGHSGAKNPDGTPAVEETLPVAGVIDVGTGQRLPIRIALSRGLLESNTAHRLLQAQAATGGIVDVADGRRLSLQQAADRGLITWSSIARLSTAQKAYTGFEDPLLSGGRLSVTGALRRGKVTRADALHFLEAQHLTGGLVEPNRIGRVPLQYALNTGLIDRELAAELGDRASHPQDIVDPGTNERVNYAQLLARCSIENYTKMPLIPTKIPPSSPIYHR